MVSTIPANWAAVTNFIARTQATPGVNFTASNSPARFHRAMLQQRVVLKTVKKSRLARTNLLVWVVGHGRHIATISPF